ncbi:MAG TPA: energy transducer TonB [Candidatus Acidoferrales bacterium]
MKKTLILAVALTTVAVLVAAQSNPRVRTPRADEPEFVPAQVIASVEAPYPHTSIAEGTVVFEVTVGASGQTEAIRAVRTIASLTEAGERSLRGWRFRAATLDGKPVRSTVVVAFSFTRPVVTPRKPGA